jgi:hypothetical protein
LHLGEAILVQIAMEILGKGYHGSLGDPEGLVYRYEDSHNSFICSGKYVSNPLLGDEVLFHVKEPLFNKHRYSC